MQGLKNIKFVIIGSLIISNDDDSSKNAAKKMNLMLSLSSSLWLLMLNNRLLQYCNLEASLILNPYLKSTCSQTIYCLVLDNQLAR